MTNESRLAELIDRWQSAYDRGEPIPAEDLCRDMPDLLSELRRRIASNRPPLAETQLSGTNTTPGTAAPAPAAVGNRLGGFQLIRELGRGGMGVVFEAEDSTLGRRVALKTLHSDLAADDGYRQRFLREARAAAALRHDHVITLHQVGQDGETPFLVMEFLSGETLADRLTRQASLPVPEAVRIAKEMAEGLAAAHEKGLVHRDVKPANVWLEAPKGRVKILDFGLARPTTGPSLTALGTVAGTVGYMAPEQIFGGALDGRTDLYALGCVLYQMLWGAMPFMNSNTMQLLEAVISQDAPNLDAVAKTVPAPLGSLMRRLLARNPDERPANAAVVAAELSAIQDALSNPERVLRPATTEYRQMHAPSRKFGMWAGGGVVVIAIVFGAIVLFDRFAHHRDPDSTGGSAVPSGPTGEPIKVGVLHSVTGLSRDSEKPMVEAIHIAVDEINGKGILGRPIQLIVEDPGSNETDFVSLAEKLILKDKVDVIFGCWTSASRKWVGDVCRKHNNLLVHAVLCEGLEENPNVIYVGGGPNLQLQEAVNYVRFNLLKKKFFIIGSDNDLYSVVAREILSDEIKQFGGEIVGNELVPFGDTNALVASVNRIKTSEADVIMNNIDGLLNIPFERALRQVGIDPKKVPTVWIGIGEDEMGVLDRRQLTGDLSITPYFHSIDTPANKAFLSRVKEDFRTRQRVSDATEASYCAVYLWKQAVEKAGSTEPIKVRDGFRGQSFDGPEGKIKIDPVNLYAWRHSRVGEMRTITGIGSAFEVVKERELIAPIPFPRTRTKAEWEEFEQKIYKEWGGWVRKDSTTP